MDTKITALDEKVDTKIDALDEKIDSVKAELKSGIAHLDDKVELMNKYNERLLDLLHPTGQK
ncbi:MAG: hypothetical protein ACYCSB_05075 [bacterium]|jgi:hypothetical protein